MKKYNFYIEKIKITIIFKYCCLLYNNYNKEVII